MTAKKMRSRLARGGGPTHPRCPSLHGPRRGVSTAAVRGEEAQTQLSSTAKKGMEPLEAATRGSGTCQRPWPQSGRAAGADARGPGRTARGDSRGSVAGWAAHRSGCSQRRRRWAASTAPPCSWPPPPGPGWRCRRRTSPPLRSACAQGPKAWPVRGPTKKSRESTTRAQGPAAQRLFAPSFIDGVDGPLHLQIFKSRRNTA